MVNPTRWTVATGSARGARHALHGEPSEDACGSNRTAATNSIAVADGHSSPRCPRARTGAEFAVNAALEIMGNPDTFADPVIQIVDRWRQHVDKDLAANPPNPDEPVTTHRYLLYGTTLLSASASRHKLRLFQIGDGDILFGRHGDTIYGRQRWSDGLLVETDSLASCDAAERVFYAEYDLDEIGTDLVAIVTDGFGSAFAEPDWGAETLDDLRSRLTSMDPSNLPDSVARWCEGPAAMGGDDTTLALLANGSVFTNRAIEPR